MPLDTEKTRATSQTSTLQTFIEFSVWRSQTAAAAQLHRRMYPRGCVTDPLCFTREYAGIHGEPGADGDRVEKSPKRHIIYYHTLVRGRTAAKHPFPELGIYAPLLR